MEVSLSLTWYRRNASNCQENDGLLENLFTHSTMLKKSVKVPEYVRHWYHDSKIISSNILQVLLRLSLCRRNASNYRQNDKFLETCFFVNKLVVGNSFRYFNNNQRKSLVTKDNMKFSRICPSFEFVWIIIHKRFICFKDSAFWNRGNNN